LPVWLQSIFPHYFTLWRKNDIEHKRCVLISSTTFVRKTFLILRRTERDITKITEQDITKITERDITKITERDITKITERDITKITERDITKTYIGPHVKYPLHLSDFNKS
jgi:hypothetical protein